MRIEEWIELIGGWVSGTLYVGGERLNSEIQSMCHLEPGEGSPPQSGGILPGGAKAPLPHRPDTAPAVGAGVSFGRMTFVLDVRHSASENRSPKLQNPFYSQEASAKYVRPINPAWSIFGDDFLPHRADAGFHPAR